MFDDSEGLDGSTSVLVPAGMTKSVHICSGSDWGGLEMYVGTTLEALVQQGHQVVAWVRPETPLWNFLQERRIHTKPFTGYPHLNPVMVWRMRHLIHRWNPDAVHVHTGRDLWVASPALFGNPHPNLVISHYMWFNISRKDPLHTLLYKRVDWAVCTSDRMAAAMRRHFPMPEDRWKVIRYGRRIAEYNVDPDVRLRIRRRHGIPDDAFVVGTMSRLDPQKGILEAVEAAADVIAAHPDVRFLVVGSPTNRAAVYVDYERRCRHAAASAAGGVIFTEFQENFLDYLAAMDLLLLPSHWETFSLAVLDAFAMGIPVVATDSGGSAEVVKSGETGWLVAPRSSRAIAEGLIEYLKDRQRVRRNGANGRRLVEQRYGLDRFVEELVLLYRAENGRAG